MLRFIILHRKPRSGRYKSMEEEELEYRRKRKMKGKKESLQYKVWLELKFVIGQKYL